MDFGKEIELLKERNRRVETDKAWETSWTRRIFISIFTYVIAGVWLLLIRDSYPWLKAFVPAAGYILSTLSIAFVRERWGRRRRRPTTS
jgi:hypothetical protein